MIIINPSFYCAYYLLKSIQFEVHGKNTWKMVHKKNAALHRLDLSFWKIKYYSSTGFVSNQTYEKSIEHTKPVSTELCEEYILIKDKGTESLTIWMKCNEPLIKNFQWN